MGLGFLGIAGGILILDGIISIRLKDRRESHRDLKRFGRVLRMGLGTSLIVVPILI